MQRPLLFKSAAICLVSPLHILVCWWQHEVNWRSETLDATQSSVFQQIVTALGLAVIFTLCLIESGLLTHLIGSFYTFIFLGPSTKNCGLSGNFQDGFVFVFCFLHLVSPHARLYYGGWEFLKQHLKEKVGQKGRNKLRQAVMLWLFCGLAKHWSEHTHMSVWEGRKIRNKQSWPCDVNHVWGLNRLTVLLGGRAVPIWVLDVRGSTKGNSSRTKDHLSVLKIGLPLLIPFG